jgi:glycosyltransferase involved in cell wall biosynthesis
VVRHLERGALRKLTAVICNSQYTKRALSAEYHLPADRLHVIYKSIDLGKYAFQPLITGGQRHRILFIGGNVQRKGLPTLIRSAPAILAAFPQTEFLIVGDNQNLGAMKSLCLETGVDRHFQFLGWQSHDQIQNHYRQASVFVMPSLIEAFGVVFLEAMASGVPVVGGDVGGTRELIQNGVNGFLVKPRDHRELSEKIVTLLENEGIRHRLIANGRETAKRYSVESMLEKTYRLYQRLLS